MPLISLSPCPRAHSARNTAPSVVLPTSSGLCCRLGHGELRRSPMHQEHIVVFPPIDPSARFALNPSPAQVGVRRRHGFSSSGQPDSPRSVPSCPERRLWVSNLPPPFFRTNYVSPWVILAHWSRSSSGCRVVTASGHCSPSPSPNLGVEHSYPLAEAHAASTRRIIPHHDGYCSPEWPLVRPSPPPLRRPPVSAPFSQPMPRHIIHKVLPKLSSYLDHPSALRNPDLPCFWWLRCRGREQRRPWPTGADKPPGARS
jgi:hypothetical protein